MKKSLLAALIALSVTPVTFAANYSVKVENLTYGSHFTPFLVAAHPVTAKLFEVNTAASAALQAMAEGGDTEALKAVVASVSGKSAALDQAEGLLSPGQWKSFTLSNPGAANTQLSVVAMVLPSNDGFAGLNSITLPTTAGTWTYLLNAYDAGTEANDEKVGEGASGKPGFPVPGPLAPLVGSGGTGIPGAVKEGFVHIHRGVLGDQNATGGVSDINSTTQRWLNPVVRVTVTVTL
jgi:Spondin_N